MPIEQIVESRNKATYLWLVDFDKGTKKKKNQWDLLTNGPETNGQPYAKNEVGPLPHSIYKN